MEEFYKNGLDFSCQNCGYCCRFKGGVVRLSQEDLENLSIETQLTKEQFIQVYCRYLEDDFGRKFLCLKTLISGDCVFWDKNLGESGGCEVYKSRPIQCSTFPFWTQILSSKETWQRQAEKCPGINKGNHFSYEKICQELLKYQKRIPLEKEEFSPDCSDLVRSTEAKSVVAKSGSKQ